MGSFLALLGIRLGRALASWGLGSTGSGAAPSLNRRPCCHIGAPVRLVSTTAGAPTLLLFPTVSAPARVLTVAIGRPEAC